MNQKRRSQIAQMLEEQKAITNKELMECFGISIETVRRDLTYLENQGILTKVYGGAVKKEVVRTEIVYTNREQKNYEEKKLIAEAAENFIEPNDIVFFDLGTTVEMVAKILTTSKNIFAFTNAIRTAIALSERGADVVLTGGKIRQGELSLSGPLAETNLNKFNINTAIIGAAGITESGVSDFIADEAGIRNQVIKNANRVVVLADFAKFGVRAMCQVCSLDDIDVIITDTKAPKNILKEIEKKGIQIVIVK